MDLLRFTETESSGVNNVSARYEAGLWVPTWYGDRFKIARKGHRRPVVYTHHRRDWNGGRETIEERGFSEENAETYPTLSLANVECDRLNRSQEPAS